MITRNRFAIPLIIGTAALGLTGCQQIEQAANQSLEKASQTAIQALDDAAQNSSLDQTRQSVDQVLQNVRQQAAEFLKTASESISDNPQQANNEEPDDKSTSSQQ